MGVEIASTPSGSRNDRNVRGEEIERNHMKSLMKLTVVELKLYLRNFVAAFFTLVFPILMLVLFGGIYGNQPAAIFGGYGSVDIAAPGYIAALIIGTSAFMSLPMDLAVQRQLGVLRRLRATPLHPALVLGSKILTNLLVSLLGSGLLIGVGSLIYHIYLPSHWLAVGLGMLLSSLSLYALGFALASLVRPANAVRAVCFAVFYPMMFVSGGTIPSQLLPDAVRNIAKASPMTYTVNLLHDLWFGGGWNPTAVLALMGFMLLGGVLAMRFFKWE
jgi:ABC-2 type transport system permease protein